MIEIGMNQITKNYGYNNVLSGLNLEVMTGDRMALVGRNGTGKSTILKIISGTESADKGSVSIRKGASVGILDQIPRLYDTETTVLHVLTEAFTPLLEMKRRLEQFETEMASETDSENMERLVRQYSIIQNQFITLNGYEMEEDLNRIVKGFGLEDLLERTFNVLSGGQKTIVNLAVTILKHPDILLLDEPTNHLDVKTLEWFEGFLNKYQGTVLIVSHDRYFLDKVTTKTVWLERGCSTVFFGNYTFSMKEQERILMLEFEQYKNQQKKISAMKEAIKRFQEWGRQGENPKFFKKAHEIERRLEKIELLDRPQLEKRKIPISFSGARSGREVIRLEDFSLGFGENILYEHAELLVREKEKVCLTGDNGTGKSALIKVLLGGNDSYSGIVTISPSAKPGYIPQEIRFASDKDSVLETFRRECSGSEGDARTVLARYFFYGDNVFKQVGMLSGGEKVLLKLSILMQHEINFLILDEPTNHIDIDTREILEEALMEFKGTLFCVSHDRYFMNKISARIVEVKDHQINDVPEK